MCLDGVMQQTAQPLEVIVVDNNCTDKTTDIARGYKSVKIVKETNQGRGYARSTGFNVAKGDIIARVDADCVPAPGWVERLQQDFTDAELSGVTGLAQANTLPILTGVYSTFWSRMYFWTTHSYFDVITMWGANMAVRRSSWEEVKDNLVLDDSLVHEDQDLSIAMIGQGFVIRQDNRLLVHMRDRSFMYVPKFWEYVRRAIQTKHYHQSKHTLPPANKLKISFWSNLPGAIVGWLCAVVFASGIFLLWPITAFLFRYNKLD